MQRVKRNLSLRAAMTSAWLTLFVCLPSFAWSQNLDRGPYLQSGTSSSVVVKWRTDLASDSLILYGPSPSELGESAFDGRETKDHEILIQNLAPDTTYYYSIHSNSKLLAGGDGDHFFTTHPEPGTAKPTHLWIIGDSCHLRCFFCDSY